MSPTDTLAIDGGTPVITEPLPGGGHGVDLMDEREVEAAAAVIRSKKLFRFNDASQCEAFEKEVCEYLNVKHALFVTAGTSGLICGLAGLRIGPGDEVIVPGFTYISTAAAVMGVGAVPVIAEIDESLGLDPEDFRAKITPYTKAVMPVHMAGVPCRLDAIRKIAKEHNIAVVEDCCQAVGADYGGHGVGTQSDAGAWSLNYFKTITCGESGVYFTNDSDAFERGLLQSDTAMPMWLKDRKTWKTPPFSRESYRGNEILAAIARVQLQKLPIVLAHCRSMKRTLLELLEQPNCYARQHVDDPSGDNGVSFAMVAKTPELAQKMNAALAAEGLGIGSIYNKDFADRHIYAYWDCVLDKNGATPAGYPWKDPAYKGSVEYSRDMCPRTLDILGRALRLHFHMNTTEKHVRLIATAINKVDAALA